MCYVTQLTNDVRVHLELVEVVEDRDILCVVLAEHSQTSVELVLRVVGALDQLLRQVHHPVPQELVRRLQRHQHFRHDQLVVLRHLRLLLHLFDVVF